MDRSKEIIKVSYKGIAVNVMLTVFKAIVGFTAHSTSVLLDAVNNLSDALSSVITIIGTKIAAKSADREHPYGYGRIEYITSSVVAVIVLSAGAASLKESVTRLIKPAAVKYSAVSVIIIAAAVAAKFFLGRYFTKKGKELNSSSLKASGADASGDAFISLATLVSAVINLITGLNIEGLLGIAISFFILKAGYEIISETLGNIIGTRIEPELSKGIKDKLCSYDGIKGAYDLILHSYGPSECIGSVHVELDDEMTVKQLDALSRRIVPEIYSEFGALLTIGVYASNTSDETSRRIKEAVRAAADKYPQIIQMHGFYADNAAKAVSFDLIFDFREKERTDIAEKIKNDLSEQFGDYTFYVNLDRDMSD